MHVITKIKLFVVVFLAAVFTSCSTLRQFGLISNVNVTSVKMTSVDLNGMNFEANYRIDNSYPFDIRIPEIEFEVYYFDELITSCKTEEEIFIRAKRIGKNKLSFSVPYDTIIKMTRNVRGKNAVLCNVTGDFYLDYVANPVMQKLDPRLPFTADFSVPIMKPSFSVSDIAFTAPSLLSPKASVSFKLNAKDNGVADWEYSIKKCVLKDEEDSLIELTVGENAVISSSGGSVTVSADLDLVSAAKFISKVVNQSGKNPLLSVDSEFLFLNSSYTYGIPFVYEKELQLKDFAVSK